MTKAERLLAVAGIFVVASAVLLNAYARNSNPANAAAAGCAEQRSKFGEDLDQVRFSISAAHAVSTAVDYSSENREDYLRAIETTQRKIVRGHASPDAVSTLLDQLARASRILNAQGAPLHEARAMLAQAKREVATATPLINDASRDVAARDCTALSLTMARSGWPKDRLLSELSLAARINTQVSAKLESALDLILTAERGARYYSVASK